MSQLIERQPFDKKTQEYIDSLRKDSTKKTYAAGLSEFQLYLKETMDMSIDAWVIEVDTDHFRPLTSRTNIASKSLRGFVGFLEEKSFSSNSINVFVAAVLSMFFRRVEGNYKISAKFANLPKAEVISKKEQWTLELVSEFFLSMDKQVYRSLVAVIFQSGLSLEDILHLKYEQIQKEFESGVSPITLVLKRRKTGVPFVTFLGSVAIDQLHELFKLTGVPKPDQYIFHRDHSSENPEAELRPLSKSAIEKYFARRAREAKTLRNGWVGENPRRPHSLRAAFQKLLTLAGLPEVFSEVWMGHSVKGNKAAYLIEGMSEEQFREKYRQFEFALTFVTSVEVKKN